MISKNSFWIDCKENMKRRIWPVALFVVVTLFAYPVGLAMKLQIELSNQGIYQQLLQTAVYYIGMNPATMILAAACAAISAIQGFSYLYNRSKVDMYLSEPVSAKRRFWVIYWNGILIYLVPYLVAVVLAILVAGSQHVISGMFLACAWWGVLASMIEFLAVYNITILTVMLTGHLAVTCMGVAVFLGYEWVLNNEIGSYCSTYFKSYAGKGARFFTSYKTSPVVKIMDLSSIDFWSLKMNFQAIWNGLLVKSLPILFVIVLQAVVALVLAYIAYRKRPMEACGHAMAFPITMAPIKVAIVFLAGICGSNVLKQMSQGNESFAALGLISGLLLGQCLVEIIYEFDLRAIIKGWKSLLVASVLAVLFYLSFVSDLFGYDRYVPDASQVVSAGIDISFDNSYSNVYLNAEGYSKESGDWIDYNYELLDHMQLKDTATILALAKDGMNRQTQEDAIKASMNSSSDRYVTCTVCYNLKSGKKVYRSFPIRYHREEEKLNKLFADKNYKNAVMPLATDAMAKFTKQCTATYSDGVNEKRLMDKNATNLMKAYQKDYTAMTFTQAEKETPVGLINLYYKVSGYQQSVSYPVFPSYQNTIACLKEKQAYTQLQIDPKGIASIQITNYQTNPDSESSAESESGVGEDGQVIYPEKTYDDPKQISKIAKYLQSTTLAGYSYFSAIYCNDLSITVNGADNMTGYQYNWQNQSVEFKMGEIPDFVCQDLNYTPKAQEQETNDSQATDLQTVPAPQAR